MQSLATITTSLSTLKNELAQHNIKLKALPSQEIPHIPNIGDAVGIDTFKNAAKTAYDLSTAPDKVHFVVAFAYTRSSGGQKSIANRYYTQPPVGPGCQEVTIPIVGQGLTNPAITRHALWRNLVPGEGCFVSAKFLRNGGYR